MNFNYYNNLELFNILKENSRLYFTTIDDCLFEHIKIKKLKITNNLPIYYYHIYANNIEISEDIQYNLNNYFNLKDLYLHGRSNYNIKCINPVKLYITYNDIYDINHMTNLRILYANNKLSDKNISNLNLIKFSAPPGVSNVNHMTNLKELHITGNDLKIPMGIMSKIKQYSGFTKWNYGITNEGIANLNLVVLTIHSNPNVTNFNHMTNLKCLALLTEYNSRNVCNTSIKDLNLSYLTIQAELEVFDLNHMSNLKELELGESLITDECIRKLNLIKLNIDNVPKITTLNHMSNLKILILYRTCKNIFDIKNLKLVKLISNSGSRNDINSIELNDINNMTTLKILKVHNRITDKDIHDLNLVKLHIFKESDITDISHMIKFKHLIICNNAHISNGIPDNFKLVFETSRIKGFIKI